MKITSNTPPKINRLSFKDELFSKVTLWSFIILLIIFTKEVSKQYFLVSLDSYRTQTIRLDTVWLCSQIVFSLVLGRISDKSSRKAILLFSVCFSIISPLVLFYSNGSPSMLILAVALDGLGVVTPLARAAYFDIHTTRIYNLVNEKHRSTKKLCLLVHTIAAQSIPWVIFCSSTYFFNRLFPSTITLHCLSIFTLLIFFKDTRDKDLLEKKENLKRFIKKFTSPYFLLLAGALLILEFSYQLMPYYGETRFPLNTLRQQYFSLGIGILGGSLFLVRFLRLHGIEIVRLVFSMAAFFFFSAFLVSALKGASLALTNKDYLVYSIFGGMAWPLIFSLFTRYSRIHEDGLLFGCLDSIQSIAELLGLSVLRISFIENNIGNFMFFSLNFIALILIIITSKLKTKSTKLHEQKG